MKPSHCLIPLACCAAMLAACDATSPSPEPPAPATAMVSTPAPAWPTATALPAPPRTVPTLAAPTRAPLLAALNKTQSAKVYRVALNLNVKIGNTPPFALNLQSEVNGNDERSLYQLGSESIELIEVNGQHYVKGARSLGVPSASKWYSITPDLADAVRFPFSPQEILAAVAGTGLKQNFLASARESLDAMNCSVWSYAPKSLADLGVASALGLDASVSAFESVDQSEIKLWVCDDGAVHQLSIEIAAHKTSNAAEKGSLKLQIHAWDFGSAIKIAAPAGAEPFQLGAPKP